eukprot:1961460-Prymnesium_polylepis.3
MSKPSMEADLEVKTAAKSVPAERSARVVALPEKEVASTSISLHVAYCTSPRPTGVANKPAQSCV